MSIEDLEHRVAKLLEGIRLLDLNTHEERTLDTYAKGAEGSFDGALRSALRRQLTRVGRRHWRCDSKRLSRPGVRRGTLTITQTGAFRRKEPSLNG